MDLETLIAQWSGKLPPGFVPHAVIRQEPPQCCQPRCKRPASLKANGEYAKSCEPCRIRRANSCKRRRLALVAEGGCRRCAYRKTRKGDFLCARCRQDRDIERAQKRQDAKDAAVIDEFAAQPDRARRREQPRPGRVAVERTKAARTLGGLLVAAARPGTAGRTRVGEVDLRQRQALPSLLSPPFPPGARGFSWSRVPNHQLTQETQP